jgi:hypothetical protein
MRQDGNNDPIHLISTKKYFNYEKKEKNKRRGRPRGIIPISEINKFMKEKDYAEKTKHNTNNAIDIGKIHASPIWQSSNKNVKQHTKF